MATLEKGLHLVIMGMPGFATPVVLVEQACELSGGDETCLPEQGVTASSPETLYLQASIERGSVEEGKDVV